ncbi:membrane-associated protein [Arcanobacterium pluranimalium]|uniref:DedA family protein n=1 Tax=Arcanobacterium pluranimalium TaxID=108028 RepID=UPI001956F5D1|nr:DedA family protein [Arcanobacterium pluranimalium]MBM7825157.1 membrane-associated protein [Arcanobacterium pluranimalium]
MGIIDWIHQLSDPTALISHFGTYALLGIAIIIFIESGVLFPFLPGDSLLITIAVLHHSLGYPLWVMVLVACLAAIAGDQVGFWLGRHYGRKLFSPDAKILKTERLDQAEAFFAKYGPLALVLGRYLAFVRTYVPLGAGISSMRYRHFAFWNIAGAITWVFSMVTIGVLIGQIPGVTQSIERIMLVFVVVTGIPVIIGIWKNGKKSKPAEQLAPLAPQTIIAEPAHSEESQLVR